MACGHESEQGPCQQLISLTDPAPWWNDLAPLAFGVGCFTLGWFLFKGRLSMRTSLSPEQMAKIDKAVGATFMLFGVVVTVVGLLGLGSDLIVSLR